MADALRLLATGDPAVALLTCVHYTIIFPATGWAPLALRSRLLAEVVTGDRIGNAASEREPPREGRPMNTTISIGADGLWRIKGRECYVTGANGEDCIAIATEDPDGRVVIAVVPAADPRGWPCG